MNFTLTRYFYLSIVIGIALFLATALQAQDYPKDYFRSPLDIPLFLAGNFAEIRSNHFHAGIDIKTEGVQGKKVYAAADGYVSRIKIGEGGYGKALYITHPNGYTTVYAHLQKFNNEINEFVKQNQYLKESYEIELFPVAAQFKITKGDVVAISGNSGGSGGPHLHFEIRETKSEVPVNPLLFGFDIKDNIQPIIKFLGIYPVNGGKLNNTQKSRLLKVKGTKGSYKLETTKALIGTGKIGLGVEVQDYLNGSSNRCGVYSIELEADSTVIYCHEMDKVGFHESRYINAHVNFYDWKKNKSRIQQSFVQPNNKLSVYNCDKEGFTFDFKDNNIHHFKYTIRDTYGNASFLSFDIQSVNVGDSVLEKDTISQLFIHNKSNRFATDEVKINLPPNILYDDVVFDYKKTAPIKGAITPTHHILSAYYPLHKKMALSIKLDSINGKYKDKIFVAALDEEKVFLATEGGIIKDNWITIYTRSFGPYTVMMDTISPKIKPFNIVKGRDMTTRGKIQIQITDNLSGIKSYRGTIDGKWVLMEYDYKLERLTYFIDENRLEKGKTHTLVVEVADERKNKTKYTVDFIW